MLKVTKTAIPEVLILEPKVFKDDRGFFMENYNQNRFQEATGLDVRFVQDNYSYSQKGVLRGLHFQNPNQQGKLVFVLQGEVYDVAVDIRVGSPTFGKWVGVTLSAENKRQLYVPEGFAHGFCVTGDRAVFVYKCTDYYNPESEGGILWNDPDIKVEWPISAPIISKKDNLNLPLKDFPADRLPKYGV